MSEKFNDGILNPEMLIDPQYQKFLLAIQHFHRLVANMVEQDDDSDDFEDTFKQHEILSPDQSVSIFSTLKNRIENRASHYTGADVDLDKLAGALANDPYAAWSIYQMEETGGEPDLVFADNNYSVITDCSQESPEGRRNMNFFESLQQAHDFRVPMMNKVVYQLLQEKGWFDKDTSSWVADVEGFAHCANRRQPENLFILKTDQDHSYENMGWRGFTVLPNNN